MDPQTARFTERMGQLLEAEGMPRIAGRIFGLLLLQDDARSLDELATALGVSKASVSTNARNLAGQNVVEHVTRPGDRRDYYRVTPNLFSRMMEQRLSRWRRFADAVGEGRRSVPLHHPAVRARLAEYEAAYAYMAGVIGTALGRWEPHRVPRAAARRSAR